MAEGDEDKLSEAARRRRKNGGEFAIANTELEGGTVLPEQRALFERHARGEITMEEVRKGALEIAARLLKERGA